MEDYVEIGGDYIIRYFPQENISTFIYLPCSTEEQSAAEKSKESDV